MPEKYHSYILVTGEQVKIKGVGDLGFLKSTCGFSYIAFFIISFPSSCSNSARSRTEESS